jgi:hypothetical protein
MVPFVAYQYFFIFLFVDMSTQEGEMKIRISDLRFMRRGSQLIELPIENSYQY